MFKRLFSKSTTIPVLRLSGIISSQSGLTGSGLAINNLEKLIDKLCMLGIQEYVHWKHLQFTYFV